MMTLDTETLTCPVHTTHLLDVQSHHTQDETGTQAVTLRCRINGFRWFVVEGRKPGKYNRRTTQP